MGAGLRGRASVAAAGIAFGMGLAARVAPPRKAEADLRGAVALVTGGSRGLGLALSRELAQQGCRLAICARDEIGARGGANRPAAVWRRGPGHSLRCLRSGPGGGDGRGGDPPLWPDRHPDQQRRDHRRRPGRDADPRRLRAGDGHQFLGCAQPDAGGTARDAGARGRAHRQYHLDRRQDRRAALTAIHLRQVCRGRSFRGITGGAG